MGTSSGTQNTQTNQQQTANSQTNPWGPTIDPLNSIISGLSGINTGVTPNQANAAQGVVNVGNQTVGAVPFLNNNISNGQNTAQGAYSNFLNPQTLDPRSNPYLGPAISGLSDQILGDVNGQFAAAGRDLSPANSKAAAFGLGQAIDPLLLSQYNTNVGNMLNAAQNYFGTANAANTAYGQNYGLGAGGANTALSGANTQQGLPSQNIGGVLGNLLPIAGLGGQTQAQGQAYGTQNQQKTNTPSLLSQIGQGAALGAMFLGA